MLHKARTISWAIGLNLMVVFNSQGGWTAYQSPTLQALSDVYFADSLSGWVCGVEGIFGTADGGTTWVQQYSAQYSWPFYPRLGGISRRECWATGRGDTLLHTTDGGTSWTKRSLAPVLDSMVLQGICFLDSLHGWVLSPRANHEYILRTVDGGTSWQVVGLPQGFFTLCSFVDPLDGWISGYDFVFRTTDGGKTWGLVSYVYNRAVDLQFLNDSVGWISEDGPVISTAVMKSSDGGQNWAFQLWFSPSDLTTHLFFANTLQGWVVQFSWADPVGAQIWHTNDGGSSWDMQFVYNPSFYYRPWRVFFANPRHGWIVGERGIILRTSDGGVTSTPGWNVEIPQQTTLRQNFPNPFNPETQIHFELPQDNSVRLVVHDLLGREVATLVNEFRKAGKYDVVFTAGNLASGVYFYRLQAGTFSDVKKLLLLRRTGNCN